MNIPGNEPPPTLVFRMILPAFEGFCQRFGQGGQFRQELQALTPGSRLSRRLLLCIGALLGVVASANAVPVPLLNPNFDAITKTYVPTYPGTVTFVSITVTAAGYNAANFGDGTSLNGAGFTSTWSDASTVTASVAASTYFGTPAGWLGVGAANTVGYEALGANYMALKPGASVVDFAGYTVGTSVVSQLTGATIQANTKYTLTYLLGTRNATPPAAPGYLQGTSVKLTADAASNVAPANGNWSPQTLVFDTSKPANMGLVGQPLTVGFTGGAGTSIVFDNVTLDATPISEPVAHAPVIMGVAPGTGLTTGGTVVTITGANFLPGVMVRFGANAGTGVSLTGSTSITVTTPAGVPGAVNVVVENTNTLAGTNLNGFTYVASLPPLPLLPPRLRGINTSDKHLKPELFALLAETDVNVIRLGFSKDSPNPTPPTAQDPLAPYVTNLAILDAALPLARAAGIKIVLCAAETYGWSQGMFQGSAADLATYRTNLATFWTAMAQRYLNEPAIVAYDLLNEPATDWFSRGQWYTNIMPAAVAAVRSVNPNIWLMVESEGWGAAGSFDRMPVLADPYVIYSFHFYSPHSYTHQGITSYVGYTATYPGTNSMWGPSDPDQPTYWDKETLRGQMIEVINFSQAHPDKRILVGEFGVLRWAPGADQWLADSIELFEEYGWDWCNHSPAGWNGWNVTYSTNINDAPLSQAPDGGDRGARWLVLSNNWALNASTNPGTPVDITLDLRLGTQVSWSASSAHSYQPQQSWDNSVWSDFGAPLSGNAVSSRFDPVGAPFYRVLELVSGSGLVLNPGFESGSGSVANNWTVTTATGGPVYGARTNSSPRSGAYHFEVLMASTGGGPVVEFQQPGVPVTGGTAYPFSFYAKAVTGSAGHNPQWRVLWNAGGDTGYLGFTAGNNVYSLVSNTVTAPLAATSATLILRVAGAASPASSATLQFDDVTFGPASLPGATNVLAAPAVPALELSWPTRMGSTYQVQSATNLDAFGNFGPPISGDGNPARVTDLRLAPAQFYRVESPASP